MLKSSAQSGDGHGEEVLDFRQIRARYMGLINKHSVREEEIHQFLVKFPMLLPLWGPYDNIVFSKMPLGNQYEVDFAFGRIDSPGVTWHLIEIEKPTDKLFTKSHNPSAAVTHGLAQLQMWKNWFYENRDYIQRYFPFRSLMSEIGLWRVELFLIIGRREPVREENQRLLQEMSSDPYFIKSFDGLAKGLLGPICDREKPLSVCRFVGGKIQEISQVKINISYTIPQREKVTGY